MASPDYVAPPTPGGDPCVVLYTSGTTGPPKGVVHAHNVGWGMAAAKQMTYDVFPQPGDCIWTTADWAWIGGLLSCLLVGLEHGVRVVSAERAGAFDPEWALDILEQEVVTVGYQPPTALRMMTASRRRNGIKLRSISCGGEKWTVAALEEAREALNGVHLCAGFGQTEADCLSGCFPSGWETRFTTAGRVYPGHTLEIMREDGSFASIGETGEAVLKYPDPSAMLGYLSNAEATRIKIRDSWLHTGDLAFFDGDGYLHFAMRADEVIKSAGYRIGPTEVEDSIDRYPAVLASVVVGAPDPIRGQLVKAFIQLRDGFEPSAELVNDIQQHVKRTLGAYQYPRLVEFVERFP